MTFQNFKVALRNYEENECLEDYEDDNKIMNVNVGRKLKVNCYTCGLEGHKSVDCRRNEKRRNENDAGRHIRNDLWCGNCRSTSHAERFCRRNRNADYHHAKRITNEENNNGDNHTFDFSFCVKDNNTYGDEKFIKGSFIVDTGATSHIVNEDNFINEDESYVPERHFIELADGTRTNSAAKKRGTVLIHITDSEGNLRSSTLENVLYCPTYPQNIFSVRSATKKGASVRFTPNYSNDVAFP